MLTRTVVAVISAILLTTAAFAEAAEPTCHERVQELAGWMKTSNWESSPVSGRSDLRLVKVPIAARRHEIPWPTVWISPVFANIEGGNLGAAGGRLRTERLCSRAPVRGAARHRASIDLLAAGPSHGDCE